MKNKYIIIKTKKAFSMIEAIIMMSIVAIFMAASIPIVTGKITHVSASSTTKNVKGRFECYREESGEYKQKYCTGSQSCTVTTNNQNCVFHPPKNVELFDIYAVGGGGAGALGESAIGGESGEFFHALTVFSGNVTIVPATGGEVSGSESTKDGAQGGATTVEGADMSLSVRGGKGGLSLEVQDGEVTTNVVLSEAMALSKQSDFSKIGAILHTIPTTSQGAGGQAGQAGQNGAVLIVW